MRKTKTTTQEAHHRKIAGGFPFYPILLGIYPVLALTAHNITQIDLFLAYRSIYLSAFIALALFGLLRLALRDWTRAAILAVILLVLFFSYGQVYALIEKTRVLGVEIGRHRYLALVWAGLAGLGVWLSTRKRINLAVVTPSLNIVSALLLILPIYQIVRAEGLSRPSQAARVDTSANGVLQSAGTRPDIYYIILDGYGRTEVLRKDFDFDNSSFVQALTDRGFYVAICSQSNYAYTLPSLGSSLNLDYLDAHMAEDDVILQALQASVARSFLESQGYTVVAFETGYRWTQWEDADVYIT